MKVVLEDGEYGFFRDEKLLYVFTVEHGGYAAFQINGLENEAMLMIAKATCAFCLWNNSPRYSARSRM